MLSTNLVSYWKLSDTSDSVGSNALTNNNSVSFASAGKIGNCASFNGSNQYLSNSFGTINASYSFSSWVKINATGVTYMLWGRGGTTPSSNTLSLVISNGDNKFHLSNYSTEIIGTTVLTSGVWYFVTITSDGTTSKIYVNGIQEASGTVTHATTTSGFEFGRNSTSIQYLNGYLDESGLWSRVLSADEVSQLFNSGRANAYPLTDTPSLYGGIDYYKLDESSGGALDSIGSHTLTNTGTITYGTGKINNGAIFSNNTAQVFATSSLPFGTAGTIAFWAFVNTGDDGGYFTDASSANRYYFIYAADGSGQASFNGTTMPAFSAGGIVFNRWNHIVMTWDNSLGSNKEALYLNGSLYGNTNNAISASTPATFYIGNRYTNTGTQDAMNGKLDEFGIWSRALSSTEVTALYNGGAGNQYPFTTPSSGTLASFLLNFI